MNKHIFHLMLLLSAFPLAGKADNVNFTYNTEGENPSYFGYNKCDTYDIAIKIGSEMKGALVYGFEVSLPLEPEQVADMSGWATSELKIENKKNIPDMTSTEASLADGVLSTTFQTPLTVPEDGMYVGYTFRITSIDKLDGTRPGSPVAYVSATKAEGLYIHTLRTMLKWKSVGADRGVSPMIVHLSGDFKFDAADITLPDRIYMEAGKSTTIPFTLTNRGITEIRNIDYVWSTGEKTGRGSHTFEKSIAGTYGAEGNGTIELSAIDAPGSYTFKIAVTRVNGKNNSESGNYAEASLRVTPFVPKKRPLIEEYTGLWCGYCPRGYVALEELNEKYGDDLVCVSYHNDDELEVMRDAQFPIANFTDRINYPSSQIDRETIQDPSDVEMLLSGYSSRIAPASIDVNAEWGNEDHTSIRATANLNFIENFDSHDFRLAMILTADGVGNERWYQNNYFAGTSSPSMTGPYWDIFTKGGKRIYGLEYNFIVVAADDVNGVDDSLPEELKINETYSCDGEFDLSGIVNLKSNKFLDDSCSYRVVAVLVDGSTNTVVNSARSELLSGDGSGVRINAASEDTVTEYFDLTGKRVSGDTAGVLIRRTVNPGSTVVTEKIIR